jgi:hypothetical protein
LLDDGISLLGIAEFGKSTRVDAEAEAKLSGS